MAELEGIRRAIFVALTSAAVVACGRTEGLLPAWLDQTGGKTTTGDSNAGGAGAPSEPRAGAAGVARAGSAGQGGLNAAGGAAGSSPGGAAGLAPGGAAGLALGGGAGGSAPVLKACDRATTPLLDGPLATHLAHPPITSVAGDWNRDGKLDLATGNSDGSVSLLLGHGDGSFSASFTYLSDLGSTQNASHWVSLAARDVDGNGSLDLVTAPYHSRNVRVLLGAADGSFASPVTYALVDGVAELALEDFDGDGDPDIAVAGDAGVVLLANDGDGSFGVGVPVSNAGAGLVSSAAADLNHDGHVDLVTLSDRALTVLLGNGNGSFLETQVLGGSVYYDPVRIADVNADGHPDLLFPDSCGPRSVTATSHVFFGRGDGTFTDRVWSDTAAHCGHRSAVADVNGDGAADVLMTSPLTVLFGSKDGLRPPARSSKAGAGLPLGTGDWNGDGKLDLATASHEWVSVELGNGDGTFGSDPVYATAFEPRSLALADLDADGVLDVATLTILPGLRTPLASSLSVLRGVADGTFLDHIDYPSSLFTRDTTAADIDGDGLLDLVTSVDGLGIGVFRGTGNASFASEALRGDGTHIIASAIADLNDDGYSDLAAAIGSSSNVKLFFGTSNGTFSPVSVLQLPDYPAGLAVADVNGDHKQDLVVILRESEKIDVLLGNGNGTFATDQLYPTKSATSIKPADLNADGKVDLVVWGDRCCGVTLSVLLGAGDGTFASRLDYSGTPNDLTAVDFNQDGRQDLVMVDEAGLSILFGAGDGTFLCTTRYVGDSMSGLGVGDLNRDGRMDVVTTSTAGVNVFLNSTP
ncbi:MAG TPA: VCBS repeat-containing protein [Polyangiaceae bacterium]|nr:VCBS repeat-containing protein [Polyangiaceae bacterium]